MKAKEILDSKLIVGYFEYAVSLRQIKEFDEAEEYYKKILEIDPGFVPAHVNLGNLLSDTKRYEEAEETRLSGLCSLHNHSMITPAIF